MLTSLLDPGPTAYDFLNVPKIARRWRESGVGVSVVRARPDLSAESLRQVLALLAPEVPNPRIAQRSNQSMSAFGVRVWREHVATSPPRLAATGLAVLHRMVSTFPSTSDPAVGGRLALRAEVAALADAYLDGSMEAGSGLRRCLQGRLP